MADIISIIPRLRQNTRAAKGGVGSPQSLVRADAASLTIADITGDAPMPDHMARVLGREDAIIVPIRQGGAGDKAQALSNRRHIRRTACAAKSSGWREGVAQSGSTVWFHLVNLRSSLGDMWRSLWDMPSAHDITIGERDREVRR